mgnify:CR=1 FL=1
MGVWKLLQACSETAVEMDAVDLLRNALSTLDAAHYISFWAQSFDAKVRFLLLVFSNMPTKSEYANN